MNYRKIDKSLLYGYFYRLFISSVIVLGGDGRLHRSREYIVCRAGGKMAVLARTALISPNSKMM